METPSSARIATRSSQQTRTKSRALHDITNDSPIVGIASDKTPSSILSKSSQIPKSTPGSGESLLRGQVKNLLQKVEEDSDFLFKKPSTENCPSFKALLRHLQSPGHLLAPTPENTPLIATLSGVPEEELENMAKVVEILNHGIVVEEEEREINRALLFDSPNKLEDSDCNGSSVTCEVGPLEESDASAWSLRVNASLSEEEEVVGEGEEYYEDDWEEEDDDGEEWFDVLCEGMSNMTVKEESKFCGKHTRFVYKNGGEEMVSPNVVVLKGMAVPEGKHLRFQEDEEN